LYSFCSKYTAGSKSIHNKHWLICSIQVVQIWLGAFMTASNKQCKSMSFLQSYFICHPPHMNRICMHTLKTHCRISNKRTSMFDKMFDERNLKTNWH
jgi:hypothetical protein